jgi:hypothetical protein
MISHYFDIGDYVKTTKRIGRIPAGSLGTIEKAYQFTLGWYDVRFGTIATTRLLSGDEIALLASWVRGSERS